MRFTDETRQSKLKCSHQCNERILNLRFKLCIFQGIMHARLLSAILAGLCDHTVKLKSTFPLFSSNRESMVISFTLF